MRRSYYSTMFKMLNGVSVWTYITNQRISKAKYILEKSDISVIEVSEKCGFSNISNFNRAFRKVRERPQENTEKNVNRRHGRDSVPCLF